MTTALIWVAVSAYAVVMLAVFRRARETRAWHNLAKAKRRYPVLYKPDSEPSDLNYFDASLYAVVVTAFWPAAVVWWAVGLVVPDPPEARRARLEAELKRLERETWG